MKLTRLQFLVAAVLAGALAGTLVGGRVLAGSDRLDDRMKTFSQIIGAVQDRYVDEVSSEDLIYDGIRGMLRTLDPHTNFLDAENYKDMQDEQRGNFYGLGIVISKRTKEDPLTVISPIDGTPAARLGVRAGDIISHISDASRSIDVDTRELSIQDAVKYLKGPKGSEVVISIERPGLSEPLIFKIVRDKIDTPSVSNSYMIRPGVGYIKLANFTQTSADDLDRAIAALRARGMEKLIFDLRSNPGGLLDQAVKVADRFLPDGKMIVYTHGRVQGSDQEFYSTKTADDNEFPVVVLINRGSASASEIVSGALQDHDRALIVGETTFGKGLVQTIMPLRNVRGYALALTTARYYTPSGRSIQCDYASTSLDDYYSPRDRQACGQGSGAAKLTDSGRKVYGGDGITPDYCVEAETPAKFVSYLIGRQAFTGFARRFEVERGQGQAQIAGTGTRSGPASAKVRIVSKDFRADAAILTEFQGYLDTRKLRYTPADLDENRAAIVREIEDQVLMQAIGEGAARRRSVSWDPQIKKALELVPRAEMLLRDPRTFVAERAREKQLADAAPQLRAQH